MAFTLESVEELANLHGAPEWLRRKRRGAFGVFEKLDLARQLEEWRRVDFRGLKLDGFKALENANGAPPPSDPMERAAGVLRQRGSEPGKVELDPDVQGFFGEVIDRIPIEQARQLVLEELETRLG